MNHDPVFSFDEALARVDDDRETFQMMAELLLEHAPKDLAAAQTALACHNADALARSSHKLKGAILQFCAPTVLHACKELEESAKAGDLTHAGELYAILEKELARLLAAIRQTLDKGIAA